MKNAREMLLHDMDLAIKIDCFPTSVIWRAPKELGGTLCHEVAFFDSLLRAEEYAKEMLKRREELKNACPEYSVYLNTGYYGGSD